MGKHRKQKKTSLFLENPKLPMGILIGLPSQPNIKIYTESYDRELLFQGGKYRLGNSQANEK